MALVPGYLSTSLDRLGRAVVLAVGNSIGVQAVTLSADATFDAKSATVMSLNGGASDRNVDAVANAEVAGMVKVIKNAGTTNALTVRDAATTTVVATLAPGQWCGLFHTGSAWVAFNPSTVGAAHTKVSTTTVTNTTTETAIGSHTLPANTIKAGTTVRIRGSFRVTGNAAADTVVVKIKIGSTAIMTSASLAMVANDVAIYEAAITGYAAPGAAAAVVTSSMMLVTVGGTASQKPQATASANYATNGTLALSATVQWSAASASDVLVAQQFSVDVTG
jgi:hypothetical protein